MKPGEGPKRKTPMPRGTKGLAPGKPLDRKPTPPKPRSALPRPTQPMTQVSDKRRAENVVRREMLKDKTGGEPVLCERCGMAWANDGHELVRRSQGGSIVDPDNVVCVCRDCHDWIGRYPAAAREEGWDLQAPPRQRVERAT